jgi:hypothetical protein
MGADSRSVRLGGGLGHNAGIGSPVVVARIVGWRCPNDLSFAWMGGCDWVFRSSAIKAYALSRVEYYRAMGGFPRLVTASEVGC